MRVHASRGEIRNRWRDSRKREGDIRSCQRPSDVGVLLRRLSGNKRRPEATDNTRFHKFLRVRRFTPCKLYRCWARRDQLVIGDQSVARNLRADMDLVSQISCEKFATERFRENKLQRERTFLFFHDRRMCLSRWKLSQRVLTHLSLHNRARSPAPSILRWRISEKQANGKSR